MRDEDNSIDRVLSVGSYLRSKMTTCTTTSRATKVKEAAEKQHRQKMTDMLVSMELGEFRIQEQRRKMEEKVELQRMKKATQVELRNLNVERQKKKNDYKRKKLRTQQEGKDRELGKFIQGKESLYSQNRYLQFANDLRKYHIKKEMDKGLTTASKIRDINEKFKAKDFQLNTSRDSTEIRKMMVQMMARPSYSSTRHYRHERSTHELLLGHDKSVS